MNAMRYGHDLHAGSLCAFPSVVALDPAFATVAAPRIREQGPGFYQVVLWDFEVTDLANNRRSLRISDIDRSFPWHTQSSSNPPVFAT
jgi:hypothetical protein